MQPQLILTYDNDSLVVHRDIYRIFCHAAETSLSSSTDKVTKPILDIYRYLSLFIIIQHYRHYSSIIYH